MSSAERYHFLSRPVAMLILAACLAVSFLLAYGVSHLPSVRKTGGGTVSPAARAWPDSGPVITALGSADWSVFRNIRGGPGSATGSLAQRFRLAGIFCWSPDEAAGKSPVRRAIIDNVQVKPVKEYVAGEGDVLDGVTVAKVNEKSVILRDGTLEHELFLAYAGSNTGAVGTASAAGPGGLGTGNERVLSTNRFGAYVGENRWVMSRDGLLSYVEELAQSPARVDKLFDSMVAIYDPNARGRRVITGHQLKIIGEKEFYEAVGLREGDIVRSVNTEPVTSKRRAMKWIDDFRSGKESAFVLDIERNGSPMRLEYMIR